MKKIIISLNIIAFLTTFTAKAEGIQFFQGTWEEALREAAATDKIIFLDAYTSWCGPCKMMAAKVFPLKEVGDFYNTNFINVKLDMEKDTDGRLVRGKYGVNSFPTFLYVDGTGNIVHRTVGAKQPQDFIAQGDMALRKVDKSLEFEAAYNNGDRSPELIYKYVKALNKAGKPSLKIANDYLHTQTDLTTPFNLKFLLEATTESDSRIFDLLVANKAKVVANTSVKEVDAKITAACLATVQKAIKFNSPDLVKEAKEKAKHLSDATAVKDFNAKADMEFYKQNPAKFTKACATYLKGKGATAHSDLANQVLALFPNDKAALKKAEAWSAKAVKMSPNIKDMIIYTEILHKNNKTKQALGIAQQALSLAEKEQTDVSQINQLIEKLKLSMGKT